MFGLNTAQIVIVSAGVLASLAVVMFSRVKLPAVKLPWQAKEPGKLTQAARISMLQTLQLDALLRGEASDAAKLSELLPRAVDKRGEA